MGLAQELKKIPIKEPSHKQVLEEIPTNQNV